jgi:ribosomal protein S18 acetylase RimI-like enzyme
MLESVHERERLEEAPGPEFLDWLLGSPSLDPETDTLLATTPAGDVIAMAASWATVAEEGSRSIVWFDAHPDHANLAPFLLDWAAARGRLQLSDAEPSRPAVLRGIVEEHRSARRAVFEAAGFRPARSFVRMALPLHRPPPDPGEVPAGITVAGWRREHDFPALAVSNAAFADHWGSLPYSEEGWRHRYLDDESFRRDLSFVALENGAVVSIVLCEVDAGTDPLEQYVARVATLPERRRRGLAGHLLDRALQAGSRAGMRRAALHVDESSATTGLYERRGFQVTDRTLHYVTDA